MWDLTWPQALVLCVGLVGLTLVLLNAIWYDQFND